MRMRVIKPDYWKSPKLANLSGDWDARLVLAGVWSYVEDNGVGLDNPTLVAAELFPFEEQTMAVRRVTAALDRLFRLDHIDRYKADVEGTQLGLLGVCDWKNWQKPDNPSATRYPQSDRVKGKKKPKVSRGSRESLASDSPPGDRNTEIGDRNTDFGDRNAPRSLEGERGRKSGTLPAREDDNDERNRQLNALEERFADQFRDGAAP
jgi:hypothetical protein